VQLLWDEGMAQRAAEYLESHPHHKMVILAGSGHIAYGSGIPRRLVRRVPVSTATLLCDWEGELEPEIADFLLLPQRRELPPAGRIGALLDDDGDGLRIHSCTSGSPCQTAGLRHGDRIASIDGQPIADLADLRVAMWNKSPGDEITLEVIRKRWFSAAKKLEREIALQ
jgi:membrane-associated protease RseP (regulator of RpoE activity)